MISALRRWWSRGEVRFGRAEMDDAAALAAVHARSFHRGWSEFEFERLLVERNVRADLATAGRVVVGFILSRQAADEAEILSVAVDPAMRGQRIATRLLALHLGDLATRGVATVFLEVDRDNASALRLYLAAGFREVGERKAYYERASGAPSPALVLRRDIA